MNHVYIQGFKSVVIIQIIWTWRLRVLSNSELWIFSIIFIQSRCLSFQVVRKFKIPYLYSVLLLLLPFCFDWFFQFPFFIRCHPGHTSLCYLEIHKTLKKHGRKGSHPVCPHRKQQEGTVHRVSCLEPLAVQNSLVRSATVKD